MRSDDIKRISSLLKEMNLKSYNTLSLDDKIALLEYMIDSAVSTDFIKDIIKEDLEKRNNINKEKNQLLLEMKQFEQRKRELERQEKFTDSQSKVETLNKKLSTLHDDNNHLSRLQLTKLKKSLEQEREKYISVNFF